MATTHAMPFRLALLQLGPFTPHKSTNIDIARRAVTVASSSTPKPDLIVLPEIWNSPYAVTSFSEYSEAIPEIGSTGEEGEGETVKAMREMAKGAGCWLIGGTLAHSCCEEKLRFPGGVGSIPEREASTDNIYNCSTAYDPQGKMVAKHRKVHLFDIDIPGRQTFKASRLFIDQIGGDERWDAGVGYAHRWKSSDDVRGALWQDWVGDML